MSRPVSYEQTDARWRHIPYSRHNDKTQTIGTSGCGPTCAAMAIATLRDKTVTPVETCAWAVKHGYRTDSQGTDFAYFVPQLAVYGIAAICTWDKAAAAAALAAGRMVVGRARKGLWTSSGHYILGYGTDSGHVLVNDPNSTAANKERAPLAVWQAQVQPYWIIREAWHMQIKDLEIKVDDHIAVVAAVTIDSNNFIKLRDIEKLAPVKVGYDEVNRRPEITILTGKL